MVMFTQVVQDPSVKVHGVLHLGAHFGEEAFEYAASGVPVWWVEANPSLIPSLEQRVHPYGHHVIQALISDRDNETREFYITNNDSGASSSMLPLGTHQIFAPQVVVVDTISLTTSTVDTLCEQHRIHPCNYLAMDLQGAELLALRGASQFLQGVQYIETEINEDEVYVGCGLLPELEAHLHEFERTKIRFEGRTGWGDAFYVRKHLT